MAGDKGHRQNKLWEKFGMNGHNGQVVGKRSSQRPSPGKDGVLEQNDQGMVTWKCVNQLQTGHRVDGYSKTVYGDENGERERPTCPELCETEENRAARGWKRENG